MVAADAYEMSSSSFLFKINTLCTNGTQVNLLSLVTIQPTKTCKITYNPSQRVEGIICHSTKPKSEQLLMGSKQTGDL